MPRRRSMSCEEFGACMLALTVINIIVGFMVAMILLFDKPKYPAFSIDEFYIPDLTKTSNITRNHTLVNFGLKIRNKNVAIGMHYDDLNLTFSYIPNTTTAIFIGKYIVPRFYQGNGKTKHVREVLEINDTATLGKPVLWNGTMMMVFKLDVATNFRYKLSSNRKRHKIEVGGAVAVSGTTGAKIRSEPILLVTSGATVGDNCCCLDKAGLVILYAAFILMFIY